MSQENVELVRRSFEAYRQDGLDALLRYFDPQIEWSTTGRFVEGATRFSGQGKSSGAPVEMRMTQVGVVRSGKIVSIRNYTARADALEAAGLSE